MLHLASFSAFLKIPEVLRPAAAATRLGPGPTASSSDQGSEGVEMPLASCPNVQVYRVKSPARALVLPLPLQS